MTISGYSSNPTDLSFGGTVIDFHTDSLDIYYEYRDLDLDIANTSMCDAMGTLIYYSDNFDVHNAVGELMHNGENISISDSLVHHYLSQAMLSLPAPGNDSSYYIINQILAPVTLDGNIISIHQLLSSEVHLDWHSDTTINTLGYVTNKAVPILEDTLLYGRLTATRHANGRDWWMLVPEYKTPNFYTFLIDPQGIHEPFIQTIGDSLIFAGGVGQAVFSPDGSKYVNTNGYSSSHPSSFDAYDFDRCSGLLSNFERIELDSSRGSYGVAISPNNQFAYFSYYNNFYQIDLTDSPLSLNLIQEFDGFQAPFNTVPFLAQLGPDGKIYFRVVSSSTAMHVIESPNEPDSLCNLIQHGVELPTYNNGTIPNHPNYRLGRLIGSDCDTIDWTTPIKEIALEVELLDLKVYPNPATSNIQIEWNHALSSETTLEIHDTYGGLLLSKSINQNQQSIACDIEQLPNGVYTCQLRATKNMLSIGRFVKV